MVEEQTETLSDITYNKKDMHVLVVDDEQVIVDLITRTLKKAGYSYETATDGFTAYELISQKTFDLIITDIVMPTMTGIELIQKVQQAGYKAHVIFITGQKKYDFVYNAIQLQSLGFIEKPFSLDTLKNLIDQSYQIICNAKEQQKREEALRQSIEDKQKELQFRTERLVAEKEILHGIISSANFGLVAMDNVGAIYLMNSLAGKLIGIKESDSFAYIGRHHRDLIPGTLTPVFTQLFNDVLETRELRKIESFKCEDGTSLNIIAYPLYHVNQINAVIFIIHDITEKEILQERMLQSSKLASIGELAAGVAHEINNPLGFVLSNTNTLLDYIATLDTYLGFLESLVNNRGNEKDMEAVENKRQELDVEYIRDDITSLLEETKDGLKRIQKIVLDLKTFARADSDVPEKHQVNSLIDDALNLVRNETKYKLTIKKTYADLPEILCYSSQLVQVFTNLFINASHAVPEKGTLEITTSMDDSSIIISIKDNGTGIPEHVLPRIFDPFFTTKEAGKGTGLGLSISYGIIKKHGGNISVKSKEGEGTEFIISLPVKNEMPSDKKEATKVAE